MAVTTKDNQTFDFTLTSADYQLLLQALGYANALAEHLKDAERLGQFWQLSRALVDVKIAPEREDFGPNGDATTPGFIK
jgi:hypothetical protein